MEAGSGLHEHASYDGAAATLFWRQLLQASRPAGPRPPHPGGVPNYGDFQQFLPAPVALTHRS